MTRLETILALMTDFLCRPPTSCAGSRQTCKVCGRPDKFNFSVPDHEWARIVPEAYRGLVVCLACFDLFAHARGEDYALGILYFVGDQRIVEFRPVSDLGASPRRSLDDLADYIISTWPDLSSLYKEDTP